MMMMMMMLMMILMTDVAIANALQLEAVRRRAGSCPL